MGTTKLFSSFSFELTIASFSKNFQANRKNIDCITDDIDVTLLWWMGVVKTISIWFFLMLFDYGYHLICLKC